MLLTGHAGLLLVHANVLSTSSLKKNDFELMLESNKNENNNKSLKPKNVTWWRKTGYKERDINLAYLKDYFQILEVDTDAGSSNTYKVTSNSNNNYWFWNLDIFCGLWDCACGKRPNGRYLSAREVLIFSLILASAAFRASEAKRCFKVGSYKARRHHIIRP